MEILLISDSTGETVTSAMKAAASQFPDVDVRYHLYPFLRDGHDLDAIEPEKFKAASVVAYTIVDERLKQQLMDRCARYLLPAISVIDPLVMTMSRVLGQPPSSRPGQQYQVNSGYLDKVSAIDFAISHDDGRIEDHLLSADVILIGVSRTSKTPTCIYLAYQGIKAANVPLVPGQPEPPELAIALGAGVPGIGLTVSASRLVQVRKTRLRTLGTTADADYSDQRQIEEELISARILFDKYDLPVIDVTRRSIEETAAAIRYHLSQAPK